MKQLNNLSSNNLSIGQILKVYTTSNETSSTSNNNYYTVKAGDSLYKIATNFNTSVEALKTLNNLSSNLLSIGQLLKIPSQESNNDYILYTVKAGDSLYKIANNYNTSVETLKALNNLSSNLLSIGQLLKIPNIETNHTYYTVKKGDSLYKIATNFNTSVETLKTLNNLSSNLLSIGQLLKIT